MKNQELFDRTIAILVKAYQEGTLEHHNCYACAVGNIVAGNNGYTFTEYNGDFTYYAGLGTLTYSPKLKFEEQLVKFLTGYNDEIMPEITVNHLRSTGYTLEQLQEIERSFEGCTRWKRVNGVKVELDKEEYMFAGLMDVVDCLMEIHEATTEETQAAKELFVLAG